MLSGLQLRLNKVSELIHNSTNHKNLAMARVCVHFQEILDTVSLTECLCCDALIVIKHANSPARLHETYH